MWTLLAVTGRDVAAWNAGVWLAALALIAWYRSDGKVWWLNRGVNCPDCHRNKASCSCIDVVFTASDLWEDDDEDEGV